MNAGAAGVSSTSRAVARMAASLAGWLSPTPPYTWQEVVLQMS